LLKFLDEAGRNNKGGAKAINQIIIFIIIIDQKVLFKINITSDIKIECVQFFWFCMETNWRTFKVKANHCCVSGCGNDIWKSSLKSQANRKKPNAEAITVLVEMIEAASDY
jgi:hypothetical protein